MNPYARIWLGLLLALGSCSGGGGATPGGTDAANATDAPAPVDEGAAREASGDVAVSDPSLTDGAGVDLGSDGGDRDGAVVDRGADATAADADANADDADATGADAGADADATGADADANAGADATGADADANDDADATDADAAAIAADASPEAPSIDGGVSGGPDDPCGVYGAGSFAAATFSGDESRFLVGTGAGLARLYRRSDNALLLSLIAHPSPVTAVAASSDGRLFAAGSQVGAVKVFDGDGHVTATVALLPNAVQSLAFSPDGKFLAAGGAPQLRILHLDDGSIGPTIIGSAVDVAALAYTSDGGTLVALGHDDIIRRWSAATGASLPTGHVVGYGAGDHLALTRDGSTAACAAEGIGVRLTNVATDQETKIVDNNYLTTAMVFSGDGRRLVVSRADITRKGVLIYDLVGTTPTVSLVDRGAVVHRASQDGNSILGQFGFPPGYGQLDAGTGIVAPVPTPVGFPVESTALSADGQWVAVAGSAVLGGAAVLRASDGAQVRRLGGSPGPRYRAVTFVPGPDRLMLMTAGTIDSMEVPGGAATPFPGDRNLDLTVFAFSADGRWLAHGAGVLTLRDRNGVVQKMAPPASSTRHVAALAFSPSADRLAVGFDGGALEIWDVGGWAPIGLPISAHSRAPTTVAFSPDGTVVATAGSEGLAKLWRVSDGALFRSLVGHTGAISSLAFAPDGASIVTAGEDTTLRLWRAVDGAPKRVISSFVGPVTTALFSADGRRVGGGSRDGTARLWCMP